MSPIAGFVRARRHLFGRQTTINTPVAAKRAYAFKGVPDTNLNWTDPDIDTGAIDLVAPPYRVAPDLTAALTSPSLNYNDLPLLHAGTFGGAETGAGTPDVVWTYAPASSPPLDDPDLFTYQFGDDVLTDWFQFIDGTIESLEITGPDGLGPLTASMTWRFGSVRSTGSTDSPVTGTVPTAGLTVSTTDVPIYLKDGGIYIADDFYDVDANQVSDALHTFTLRVTNTNDVKRFANGSQNFDVSGYGRGARLIEVECTFAKTADTVGTGSESDAWMSDTAVNRYVGFRFESTVDADTATPYKWDFTVPLRYYTRTEGEIGGNTVVVLTGRAFVDPDSGVFDSTFTNTLASALL